MGADTTKQERFLEMRGTKVHLLEGGSGPPLVYLHGAGGAGTWSTFHDLLAQQFHVYAPTHPGFGHSGDLPDLHEIEDFALHYLDLLDALELEQPALVGSSLGGWIAAELCVWQPRRVGQLALLSAAGLRVEGVIQPDLFSANAEQGAQLTLYDTSLAPPADNSPEALERRLRERATLARVAWNPYLHDPRLPGRLYRITQPTLLVWGAEDRLIPPAIGERWARELPNARLHLIPACGHSSHREKPQELARVITDFLTS